MRLKRECPHCHAKSLPIFSRLLFSSRPVTCSSCRNLVQREARKSDLAFGFLPLVLYLLWTKAFKTSFVVELGIIWLCVAAAIAMWVISNAFRRITTR